MTGTHKEAIVLILDVGLLVREKKDYPQSFLDHSVHCVSMILKRKLFSESKDEIAIILCGTNESNNPLAVNNEYENISILYPLCPVSWFMIKDVKSLSESESNVGDWLDALIISLHHIKHTKRNFSAKKIVLFTNLLGPVVPDHLNMVIANMKEMNVIFNVIGPKIDQKIIPNINEMDIHLLSNKEKGEILIMHIINEVDGDTFSFDIVIPQLLYFPKKHIKPLPWNGCLKIGEDFKILISGYIRVKEHKLKPWKVMHAYKEETPVIQEKSYHLLNNNLQEVNKNDLISGYKYGNTIVPFTEEDIDAMSYKSGEKGIYILGFTSSSSVLHQNYLGENVIYIFPRVSDKTSEIALSALIQAMKVKDVVAIAYKIYSQNATPALGFLSAELKSTHECLIWTSLPFMEDIRDYSFVGFSECSAPNERQQQTMDMLVDELNLMHGNLNVETGELEEALCVKEILNPGLQRTFQCLAYRAECKEKLPGLANHLINITKPPPLFQEKLNFLTDKIADFFQR